MSLSTSTSAKDLQRPSADKLVYLFDGSMLFAYWDGSVGQVKQITSPLTSPSVTSLITTTEDGISLWADNSSGTSSDIWVASSFDDASGAGPGLHIRHASYNGSTFTWDTSTTVPGTTQANTIQCTVTWNGTYLMVIWWDGVSGSDRLSYNWTTDKSGQTGWLGCVRAAVFSQADTWSTIVQGVARHSANLAATIVTYRGNSRVNYGCMPDSANSGPVTGATLTDTVTWSGTATTAVTAGAILAVKPSGATPVYSLGTPSQVRATTGSITGSWAGDQTRTAGDLLVAEVSATGTTSAAQISTPSGWTRQLTAGAATAAHVSVYTKTAAGADAAPAFTSTISGTATMTCTLLVLKNAATTSFTDASGTATGSSGTHASIAVATSGNIATNGDLVVTIAARERAAGTTTITPSLGWANVVNDGSTSSTGHCSVDIRCGPDISRWGGRAVFDASSFTDSFGFGGPQMVIDESTGKIHAVMASPNVGGPTWTGIVYWLGTYSSGTNTVSWGTRVAVDSTSTTTGPPDVAVGLDTNGKVYVVWVTDQSTDSMKYSTLVSPFTSAVAGGTISTGASNPRYPHIPPESASMGGLGSNLPILYTDTTSSPFPINLDTSVTLPGGAKSGALVTVATAHLAAAGTKTGFAALTTNATAHLTPVRNHTIFPALVSSATAHLVAAGTKTGFAVLHPAATAHAAFAGTKTGFTALTTAASARLTAAGTKTGFSALTVNATAHLTVAGVRTRFGALVAAATAQAAFVRSHTVFAAMTAAATAQAVFARSHTVFTAFTSAATAHLTAAGTKTGFTSLTTNASAHLTAAGARTAQGALTAAATAQATFARSHTVFAALTSAATARFTAAGTKTAQGILTTTATANAAFARSHTVFSALTSAATAHLTAAGTKTAQGALTAVATAQAVFARSHTVFGALTARATAAMTAAGTKTGFGSLTTRATTVMSAAGTKSGAGAAALVANVTAHLVAAGTKTAQAALTTTAAAHSAFTGTRTRFGVLTANATAHLTAAGTRSRFGALVSQATAAMSAAGIKTRFGVLTANATAAMSAAGKRTQFGAVTVAAAARATFATTRSLSSSAVFSATAVFRALARVPQLLPKFLSGNVVVNYFRGKPVLDKMGAHITFYKVNGSVRVTGGLNGTVAVRSPNAKISMTEYGAVISRIKRGGYIIG